MIARRSPSREATGHRRRFRSGEKLRRSVPNGLVLNYLGMPEAQLKITIFAQHGSTQLDYKGLDGGEGASKHGLSPYSCVIEASD